MLQLKYLTNDIDELDIAEHELEEQGIDRSRIHVLSEDDAELVKHDLPAYSDWSKRDITRSGIMGVSIGIVCASIVVLGAFIYGVNSMVGWTITGFIAVCLLGFCTWEGGLVGVSRLNHRFSDYGAHIHDGEHLLVVDSLNAREARATRESIAAHPALRQVE